MQESKEQFIQIWGVLGSSWGINRTMAQVHALLLISSEPLCTEDIMQQLSISRGNANMNLRDLMTWTLVQKTHKPSDRKEYFKAEKDIWEVAKRIAKERKRREIQPLIEALNFIKNIEEVKGQTDVKEYVDTINNIQSVVGKLDNAMDIMLKAEENKFLNAIVKLLK